MYNDYHITMDSFGQECPANWEEIADYLNGIIDSMDDITDENGDITPDGTEKVSALWENYWNDYHSGTLDESAPVPIVE